jgi:cyclic pyranopterin phosphate synthase
MMSKLSHIDDSGNIHMVDVSLKPITNRSAIAKGEIHMQEKTFKLILGGELEKGEALTAAKIAGVMAAKKTSELIPLCHPLKLDQIQVEIHPKKSFPGFEITATIKSSGKTGVEMEALTAVSIAALTIYDMAKAVEKSMHITNIRLVEKHGGQSGDVVQV